jgi:hypothetical protein
LADVARLRVTRLAGESLVGENIILKEIPVARSRATGLNLGGGSRGSPAETRRKNVGRWVRGLGPQMATSTVGKGGEDGQKAAKEEE